MTIYNSYAAQLKEILDLKREAVAIKFFTEGEAFSAENYDSTTKCRYCQAVMLAGQGKKIILNASNIACAAAGAALGLRPLHPKLASGEAHYNVGTFGLQEAAKKIMTEMPRLEQDKYKFVAVSPLKDAEFTPDVVIVESRPEHLMWIALASMYKSGERLHFTTSVVQACCVDCTVVPFTSQKVNATLGCTGCREATDLNQEENLIGIPAEKLDELMSNLKSLSEQVIPKNRSKSTYERFVSNK